MLGPLAPLPTQVPGSRVEKEVRLWRDEGERVLSFPGRAPSIRTVCEVPLYREPCLDVTCPWLVWTERCSLGMASSKRADNLKCMRDGFSRQTGQMQEATMTSSPWAYLPLGNKDEKAAVIVSIILQLQACWAGGCSHFS